MNMKKTALLGAMCAAMTLTAFAADRPTLTIDSPENNAVVQATPGLGEVVVIKFHTDNFKVMGLNDMTKSDQTANKTTGSDATTKMASKSDTQPMSETMPQPAQSDKQNLPQSDQAPMANKNVADEGHLHVFVDHSKWYFVHSTSDPVVLVGLAKGKHTVKLDLVGEDHLPTGISQTVTFITAR